MGLNQAYLFYVFILTGILIGLLFDIFRILRKSFKTSDFITILQDILFFLLTGVIVIYTVFKFNNGELRSYVLLGISTGLTAYMLLFSKIFIKINVLIIGFIKKVVAFIINIILYPFKLIFNILRKILLKPVSFVFINIRKNVKNSINKMSKFNIKRTIFHKKTKKSST